MKQGHRALEHVLLQLQTQHPSTALLKAVKEKWVPLADRLGMWKLRYQLEDRWLALTHPKEHELLLTLLSKAEKIHAELFKDIKNILTHRLKAAGLKNFEILSRHKNLFGVYEKMKRKMLNINHITDLFAMRILVNTNAECYQALHVLHGLWRPYRDEIKDYIQHPKPNGYQSLHTILPSLGRQTVEFQIRTREMDHIAKYGKAAHAAYKKKVRVL